MQSFVKIKPLQKFPNLQYTFILFATREFCMLFLPSADFFFSKSTFLKSFFRNAIIVSNSLALDQTRQNAGPDLGPDCLQRSRQRVNYH